MESINEHIGKNLNRIRKQRNMSLDKTAELTGVSKAMLAQIERGESNPTVTTLWKIANGLKISFTSLINENRSPVTIIKKQQLDPISENAGQYKVFPLFPFHPEKQFEVFSVNLAPGCEHYSAAHNPGVEEYIFVSEGTLEIVLDDEVYTVVSEDAISFHANKEHTYRNNGDTIVKSIVLIHYQQ